MKSKTMIATTSAIAVAALAAAAPAMAENWTVFSNSDQTAYLIDVDTLAQADGQAVARIARVPRQGDVADQRHETEEVEVRCADQTSRSGLTVSYGPDGAETDRYTEEMPWERARQGTIYAEVVSYVCDGMRPAGASAPTIAAFVAAGRK